MRVMERRLRSLEKQLGAAKNGSIARYAFHIDRCEPTGDAGELHLLAPAYQRSAQRIDRARWRAGHHQQRGLEAFFQNFPIIDTSTNALHAPWPGQPWPLTITKSAHAPTGNRYGY
ncbi:MAG: hypothetical protein ABSH50_15835 [Bryobacteraceae bacterium]|jgi:hypothetical protein